MIAGLMWRSCQGAAVHFTPHNLTAISKFSSLARCERISFLSHTKHHLMACRLRPVRPFKNVAAKERDIGGMGIFLMLVPVATFCLGTWQVQRRQWKLGLIAALEEKSKAPPVDFPVNLHELEDLVYRRVKLIGTFDHSREIYMGPRPLLVAGDVDQSGGGLISSGQSGYLVITPFKLANTNVTILVNRGWVPRKKKKPSSRHEGQLEGELVITAVVRDKEARAPFMPDNTKGSPIFTYRDVDTMAQILNTDPVFVDAVDTFEGGPIGGQTRITMRNEHMSYILTWYSLCLATSFMWYRRFIRGLPLM
ncbi:surfeit locus protein 1 [Oratosquilla oratoria]|uniref:surfeit locus protein 1 n=1 Tax=Oratosquilla oratoria TaxID=337810 RepID=UPI003F766814